MKTHEVAITLNKIWNFSKVLVDLVVSHRKHEIEDETNLNMCGVIFPV